MNAVAALAAAGILISLGYYAAASIAAVRFWFRTSAPAAPLPKIAPRVAVLKPLHGLGKHLLENITSFLESDYPRVEYIFGITDYEDPAIDVPLALKAQYHLANIALVIGEDANAENPKIAKLIKMTERDSKAEIYVVSDADIAVEPDYLKRIVAELGADDDTGLVTCVYRARPGSGMAARLEALTINTDFAPLVMLSAAIEPIRYALGATVAVKRRALEAIGGFHALKDKLADDYFLGQMAACHGFEIKLSSTIVSTSCEQRSFADFWTHQLRWARTYRTARKLSLGTILTQGPFWAILFILASRFSPVSIAVFFGVIVVRLGMSALLIWKVLGMRDRLRDIWLVPFKDLIMTAVWFVSLLSNKVVWGGRELVVGADGSVREANG
ncbi:MAG: bacteriohopanetetrol glucosamine biosynthesis glycosyltransferase HpnI [Candidatus Binataceae bacterium]